MGGCSVTYCRNRFVRGSKHFFRFPKDWRKDIWVKFTQRNNYEPKGSSVICEDHFSSDCFQKKKDRVCLSKDAVPTIVLRQTNVGLQKFEIKYDSDLRCYDENDFSTIHSIRASTYQESEESIFKRKQQKLDELKTLCRFCFCNDIEREINCVPLQKLETYSIDVNELMISLGIDNQTNEIFSEIVCEQCFHLLVEIDVFKKKCRETQQEMIGDIQELDEKLLEIQNTKGIADEKHSWVKEELELMEDMPSQIESTIEVLEEEHLIDETTEYEGDEFEFDEEEEMEDDIEYIEEIPEEFNIVYAQNDGSIDRDISEDIIVTEVDESFTELSDAGSQEIKTEVIQGVDEYEVVSTDDIIKNPERNRFCFKIYECFFCKMKFAGRKTYVAHKCPITEVKCDQCDKTFNKVQAYNSHLSHVHGSLPIAKHYCPICKTVILSTRNQFKQHCRICNKQSSNQAIECEICHKICTNLKGYTIHKLFHDTRNFTTSTGEKIASDGLNVFRGTAVCELCGKEFQSMCGYRMHKRNVHRIGSEGEIFQCHTCSKVCPTRRSLFDHMRNTHRIQESPCTVCGKVFRTKILLKKHMMYHDETRRTFKCKLCPNKPGYFTNVALKRHQKSHIGRKDFQCSDCGAGFTTNHQLKVHVANKHTSA